LVLNSPLQTLSNSPRFSSPSNAPTQVFFSFFLHFESCHSRHSNYLFCIFHTIHTLIQYSSSGWTSPAGYLSELGINSCVWK
jgi:hypothetical protein